MASVDLRQELDCSICLDLYTDPVTLRCGHIFCRVCIDQVLDTQEGSGVYTCPECRVVFKDRPVLEKNRKLCNIVECVRPLNPEEVFCTYCVQSPVPALKTCLKCEASLCEIHLRTHNKSAEHVLFDPTTSLEKRQCFIHKEMWRYYCTEDSSCICVSCSLIGGHRGHKIESLDEASEKKKEKLKNVLQELTTIREETKKNIQGLQNHRREVQEKAVGVQKKVIIQSRGIQKQLRVLEKRILSDISRTAERVSHSLLDMIKQLEKKKDELSRRMRHIEELCNTSDPVTVLQEPDTGDIKERERHEEQVYGGEDLDVELISKTLHRGLSDIITSINIGIYVQGPVDIILDVNTADNNIHISGDKKTASWSYENQYRPETPMRFQHYQVMSSERFSSGRLFWEVDVRGSQLWRVGMCYRSIARTGARSLIGCNNKSWALCMHSNYQYSGKHNSKVTQLSDTIPCDRVRIYLDYEAGQLSFYSLCDPIRHLHTFSSTFTEPLHAALWLRDGYIKISG